MAANFFDEELDNKFEDDFEDGRRSQTPSRKVARRIGRASVPRVAIPAGLEWYDCVMIPLLAFSAICILFNFPEVSYFFFRLTIWVIDIAFLLIVIAGLIFVFSLIFRRRRYYW